MGRRYIVLSCVLLVAFAVGGSARVFWEHLPQADAQQEDCEIVDMFNGESATTTQPFEVVSDDWRVFYNFEGGPDGSGPSEILVYSADNDQLVQTIPADQPGGDTAFVNAGAGRYYLEVGAIDARWDITVEDCGEAAPPETGSQPQTDAVGENSFVESAPVSPAPQRDPGRGELLRAGGPSEPPYPVTMDGKCPEQFPVLRADGCYPSR